MNLFVREALAELAAGASLLLGPLREKLVQKKTESGRETSKIRDSGLVLLLPLFLVSPFAQSIDQSLLPGDFHDQFVITLQLCFNFVTLSTLSILQRDFGDKRVFSERRRNDSYAEEEPEWFSAGPTSQSETIELIGFDDKILEEDKRKTKRSRKRTDSVKEGM